MASDFWMAGWLVGWLIFWAGVGYLGRAMALLKGLIMETFGAIVGGPHDLVYVVPPRLHQ